MGVARKVGKCILVTFNIVFLLVAIAVMAVGAVLKFVPERMFSLLDHITQGLPVELPKTLDFLPLFDAVGVALLVFGALLLLLAVTGFCWLCFDSTCFIALFAVMLSGLVVTQAVVGGMILVPDSALHSNMRTSLAGRLKDEAPSGAYTMLANLLASQLQCCGYGGPDDFDFLNNTSRWPDAMVPCCNSTVWRHSGSAYCVSHYQQYIYHQGCYDKLFHMLDEHRTAVIVIFVLVLLVQAVAVVVAVVLAKEEGGKGSIV